MTLPTLYEIMHNNPWLRPKPPSPRHRSIPIDDAAAADAGADAGGSGGGGGDDDDAAADANGEAVDSTAGEPSPPASPGSACSGGSLPMVDLSEDQERELQALHDCIADNKLEAVYVWLGDIPTHDLTDDEEGGEDDDQALGGDDGDHTWADGRSHLPLSVTEQDEQDALHERDVQIEMARGAWDRRAEDALQLVLTAGDAVSGGAMTGEEATEARRAQARRIALAATASITDEQIASATQLDAPADLTADDASPSRFPKHLGSHLDGAAAAAMASSLMDDDLDEEISTEYEGVAWRRTRAADDDDDGRRHRRASSDDWEASDDDEAEVKVLDATDANAAASSAAAADDDDDGDGVVTLQQKRRDPILNYPARRSPVTDDDDGAASGRLLVASTPPRSRRRERLLDNRDADFERRRSRRWSRPSSCRRSLLATSVWCI